MLGKLHGVDGEFDSHVAFEGASVVVGGGYFCRLGDDGISVVAEPIEQNSGCIKILSDNGIVRCPNDRALTLKFRQQPLEVDIEAERPACRVQICAIDEECDLPVTATHAARHHSEAAKHHESGQHEKAAHRMVEIGLKAKSK